MIENPRYASKTWTERINIWNGLGAGDHVMVGDGLWGSRVGEGAGSVEQLRRRQGEWAAAGDGGDGGDGGGGGNESSEPPRGFFFAFRRIAGGDYLVRVSVNGKQLRMIVPEGRKWQGVRVDGI